MAWHGWQSPTPATRRKSAQFGTQHSSLAKVLLTTPKWGMKSEWNSCVMQSMGALSMRWLVFQVLHVYKQLYLGGDSLHARRSTSFVNGRKPRDPTNRSYNPGLS